MKQIINLLAFILLLQIFSGCSPRIKISKVKELIPELRSVNFESKGIYPEPVIKYFIKKIETPDKINITSGIELYKVAYYTKDEEDKKILVSGLLALPRNKKIKGVVSYHHGTNNDRFDAPSRPSREEGLAISAIFAGGGYLCLIPDYIGFGVSTEVHTYLHVETTVNAVVDFLKLGSEICTLLTKSPINDLFLVGVSQGGHTTAAVHRYVERNPVNGLHLVASSSIAGAYNLKEISIPYAIENNSVYYLGYLANSYCHIYNKPLESIISAPFDSVVPKIFDGNHSYSQIKNSLPKTADSLYTKEILSDFQSGQQDWFIEKLDENQTFDWKPTAKFRMYYGSNDKDVSPEDAENAYRRMRELGGNVQLVGLGQLNHIQTAYAALPKTRAFFDSLTVMRQDQSDLPAK
jgi:pimeloyl-ACP methyl ester carboxylesterase